MSPPMEFVSDPFDPCAEPLISRPTTLECAPPPYSRSSKPAFADTKPSTTQTPFADDATVRNNKRGSKSNKKWEQERDRDAEGMIGNEKGSKKKSLKGLAKRMVHPRKTRKIKELAAEREEVERIRNIEEFLESGRQGPVSYEWGPAPAERRVG